MLAHCRDRQIIAILERLLDIVGSENCKRTYHLDILLAQHKDICICSQKHSEVAHKAGNLATGLASAHTFRGTAACRAECTGTFRRRCTTTCSVSEIKSSVLSFHDLRNRKM